MPRKKSAGFLIYRKRNGVLEVLLTHLGGPFWKKKDDGWWGIPKGETKEGEDLLDTARREVEEEIGFSSSENPISIGFVKQPQKDVYAWAVPGEVNTEDIKSNTVKMEWPPKSGKMIEFPEIDRAEYFSMETARRKIYPPHEDFLDRLIELEKRSEK